MQSADMEFSGGFCHTGCENCGALSFNQDWYTAFKVMMCIHCKKQQKLISKGQAKEKYSITDKDLQTLGFLTKTNPQKKSWSAMKLFLESQVAMVAEKKHGDLQAIEEERQKRLQTKLEDRVKRHQLQVLQSKQAEVSNQQEVAEEERKNKVRDRLLAEAEVQVQHSAAVDADDYEEF